MKIRFSFIDKLESSDLSSSYDLFEESQYLVYCAIFLEISLERL